MNNEKKSLIKFIKDIVIYILSSLLVYLCVYFFISKTIFKSHVIYMIVFIQIGSRIVEKTYRFLNKE